MFLLVKNLGSGLPEWFWLGIVHEVAIKILTGTRLSEGFHSMMTDLPGWQLNAAFWQGALVFCHVDFFVWLHVCPQHNSWILLSRYLRERKQGVTCNIFYYLALDCHFQHTNQPCLVWEGPIQSVSWYSCQRQECLEGSLEPGYYSSQGRKLWIESNIWQLILSRLRTKIPKIKKKLKIRENNCITYGKGTKAIKCEEHVYISSTESKGQDLWTSSLYERKLTVEHTKKTFYPGSNKHAHQRSSEVSFYSFNNNKIWTV